jgi:chromosome segregation ATPase
MSITEWFPILGYLLAMFMSFMTIYFWKLVSDKDREMEHLHHSRENQNSDMIELSAQNKNMQQKIGKSQSDNQKFRDAVQKARSEIKQLQKTVGMHSAVVADAENAYARKIEYFETQQKTLMQQAQQSDADRKQTEGSYRQLTDKFDAQLKEAQQDLQRKIEALRADVATAQNDLQAKTLELQTLSAETEGLSQQEVKRLKKKVLHLQFLYSTMKGLKEMAEERNTNWEVALRSLSLHTLEQKLTKAPRGASAKDNGSKTLGVMVAEALEAIGSQLVDDGENMPNSPSKAVNTENVGTDARD